MLAYRRIGLTVKSGLDKKDEAVERILSVLKKLGADVCIDSSRLGDMECVHDLPVFKSAQDIDLLVVIGGDGTIIRAVRELVDFSVPILSVNRGTVGFLAETSMSDAESVFVDLLSGKGIVDERSIIDVQAFRGNEVVFKGHALNEVVIAQGTIARLVDLRTTVNGEPLTVFHADGLIISTPTGSTAYSLAAGGPIVHPTLAATILTPINPHSFSQKPVVIPGQYHVEVEVCQRGKVFQDTEVMLTLDGQVYERLQKNDRVHVATNGKTAKFLRRKQDTFFETLRTKLHWGERVEE